MRADYHVHSRYSDDSSTPMRDQVRQAEKLGLDELCFTDHVDYAVESGIDFPSYFREIEALRAKTSLKVKAGLEFGIQSHTAARYEDLFAKYCDKLDFVLLSVHQVDDLDLWGGGYMYGMTQAQYNMGYYEELLRVIKSYHDYSVLAHLDLIVRYDPAGVFPFEKVRDIMEEILRTAINDGKGIELNTSSWRYGLSDTQPSRAILKLYRELGGEILTLGSDAHNPSYLAAHMDEAREILRGLGYREFCTFNKMRPTFHEL